MASPTLLQQHNTQAGLPFAPLLKAVTVAICLASGGLMSLSAQESWYKIELSIFSNEALADREQERWQADRAVLDYPKDIARLKEFGDFLLIDSLLPEPLELASGRVNVDSIEGTSQGTTLGTTVDAATDAQPVEFTLAASPEQSIPHGAALTEQTADQLSKQQLQAEAIGKVGPFAAQVGAPFRFLNLERDDYLRLPANLSDFAQTNRALSRSPEHRLLFHGVWRQPVLFENEAKAILIEGGERYGNQSELQGSLTIRFNENSDRVVLDADIWLTEFVIDDSRGSLKTNMQAAAGPEDATESAATPVAAVPIQWQLPALPTSIADGPLQTLRSRLQTDKSQYRAQNVFHMLQSRAMRSNEFHYMDHPALGIVVQVEPYEVPALLEPEIENIESFGFDREPENGPNANPVVDLNAPGS
ncbi:MAG: hypothetical protein ACJA2Q_001147 [Pseudohongiellaceae bacterium]|jgi:hypothetical protein